MARNRMIRPSFWADEKIGKLSPMARLLFIAIWNFADDYGVYSSSPRRVLGECFENDLTVNESDVIEYLSELETIGVISRFQAENRDWIHVTNWADHQKIDKPSKTRNPVPPKNQKTKKLEHHSTTHSSSVSPSVSRHTPDTLDYEIESKVEVEIEHESKTEVELEGESKDFYTEPVRKKSSSSPPKSPQGDAAAAFFWDNEEDDVDTVIEKIVNIRKEEARRKNRPVKNEYELRKKLIREYKADPSELQGWKEDIAQFEEEERIRAENARLAHEEALKQIVLDEKLKQDNELLKKRLDEYYTLPEDKQKSIWDQARGFVIRDNPKLKDPPMFLIKQQVVELMEVAE